MSSSYTVLQQQRVDSSDSKLSCSKPGAAVKVKVQLPVVLAALC